MALRPSEIRKKVMAEHEMIRQHLKILRENCLLYSRTDTSDQLGKIRKQVNELKDIFFSHLKHEEEILRPLLEEIDIWGPARVEKMDKEHIEQRQALMAISEEYNNPSATSVSTLIKFIEELEQDMVSEDKMTLHPDLLRDDIITITSSDGDVD